MSIVSVVFKNKSGYSDREYTYKSSIPLEAGDMVKAPVKTSFRTAMVKKTDLSEADLMPGIEYRTITEKVLSDEEKERLILDTWDRIDEAEPDISTEQLFARVSDETGFDEDDISQALYADQLRREQKNVN